MPRRICPACCWRIECPNTRATTCHRSSSWPRSWARAKARASTRAWCGSRRGAGVLLALGIANQGISPDSLEAGLTAEFARIAREGITDAELAKAKNGYRTQLITQQQALPKAEALQTASLFLGDPEAVNTNWRRFLAVTTTDIKRVAATYFRPENSLVLLITPKAAP